MNRSLLALLLLLQLALSPVVANAAQGAPAAPGSGRLTSLDGHATRWAEQLGNGQWVLLKVWASDCAVCNRSIVDLVDFAARRADPRLRLLGVAIDGYSNRRGVDGFIRRHGVNFPTLIDDGHAVDALYRAGTGMDWNGFTPTFLLFDPSGALVAKRIGPLRTESVLRFIAAHEDGHDARQSPD